MGLNEVAIEISGDRSLKNLDQESGGLRLQRVPPTERRGRVHTSTVTIAVLGCEQQLDDCYQLRDAQHFRVKWFSGSGAGGQHRNKHQNCCRLYHLPTGLMAVQQGRQREANLRAARASLDQQLDLISENQKHQQQSSDRKNQVGTGQRGDKSRTIRFQDDRITHHGTGKSMTAQKFMRGFMDKLWC